MTEDTPKKDDYKIVSWEIDTTGRLLCDEIFHMSSLVDNATFDAYVMPYRDIAFFAARRFQVCTATSGVYRYLRRKDNGKMLRTKTEYIALEEFLAWLEEHSEKPIALMCYELYEYSPFILLQALERYGMLEKFKDLVHGFVNVYAFVKKKCKKSMHSLSLRLLAKVLLNRNDVKKCDSYTRVKLVNEILLHLCDGDGENPANVLASELQQYVKSIDDIEKELNARKRKVGLQISLKPIFSPYFKLSGGRRKALLLRSHLTRLNINYKYLEALWSKGKEIFKEELLKKLGPVPEEMKKELNAILIYHFSSTDLQKAANNAPLKIEDLVKNMSLDDD